MARPKLHAAEASARARSSELDRALGSNCLKPKPTLARKSVTNLMVACDSPP